ESASIPSIQTIQTSVARFLFLSHLGPLAPQHSIDRTVGTFLIRGEGCKGYRRTTTESSRNSVKSLGVWLQQATEALFWSIRSGWSIESISSTYQMKRIDQRNQTNTTGWRSVRHPARRLSEV